MDTVFFMPVCLSWSIGLCRNGISRTFGQTMQAWMLSYITVFKVEERPGRYPSGQSTS
jgi:hypothetical protein